VLFEEGGLEKSYHNIYVVTEIESVSVMTAAGDRAQGLTNDQRKVQQGGCLCNYYNNTSDLSGLSDATKRQAPFAEELIY
jgi:hypothetical protein